ncbi:hypothetical protein QAD02_016215 [Eretmocerus hayati]|uniref:Uncharacterized protein n=1 Tax=Eretmocerus hayati TaxID=131215 RepID=A0ACC2PBF8_9HYME|nr:hypothetical protein QAD02_016215 [Eretmocerus hayati]
MDWSDEGKREKRKRKKISTKIREGGCLYTEHVTELEWSNQLSGAPKCRQKLTKIERAVLECMCIVLGARALGQKAQIEREIGTELSEGHGGSADPTVFTSLVSRALFFIARSTATDLRIVFYYGKDLNEF